MSPDARRQLGRAQAARIAAWAAINALLATVFFVLLALDDASAHGLIP